MPIALPRSAISGSQLFLSAAEVSVDSTPTLSSVSCWACAAPISPVASVATMNVRLNMACVSWFVAWHGARAATRRARLTTIGRNGRSGADQRRLQPDGRAIRFGHAVAAPVELGAVDLAQLTRAD